MFIFCKVLCFHSPYHKTHVICLTRDISAYHHQSNVPLNQLCAPRHDGHYGKKRGPGHMVANMEVLRDTGSLGVAIAHALEAHHLLHS